MYFTSLKISNLKCFKGNHELSLLNEDGTISRWTIILGDNGVGKTTLLKVLAWMTPVLSPDTEADKTKMEIAMRLNKEKFDNDAIQRLTDIDLKKYKSENRKKIKVKPYMDDFDDTDIYDKLIRKGSNVKTSLTATFSNTAFGNLPKKNTLIPVSIDFERLKGKLEVVTPYSTEVSKYNSVNVFAYSASRHVAVKNLERDDLADPIYNLFSPSADLYDAEQVMTRLDYAATKEMLANTEITDDKDKTYTSINLLAKLKKLLTDLLPDVSSPNDIVINPPNEKGDLSVQIKTPDGLIPLFDMSLGYQTMLAWAVDLAIRMLWKYPHSDNPLEERAVVIIDEVDLHLHPKWQRSLKNYLTANFTNTQFICTAHSPFMAQSAENQNLCVLRRLADTATIENSPNIVKGWRIGQFVTSELFDLPERSFDTENLSKERRELLDKTTRTSAEDKRLAELDDIIKNLPVASPEYQKYIDQIKETADLLKKQTGLK